MNKILIYDVAAESGGAKTILDKFYREFADRPNNECFFVLSVLDYPETGNTHVIKLPWVKKSWLHRLYCDYIYMPKLIQKLGINEVLSLQNIAIPRCRVHQSVYVHNAIPFTEHRFSFSKERFLWVYQNIIGRLTYRSLKKADRIIVQTHWMKEMIARRCGVSHEQIVVKCVETMIADGGKFVPTKPLAFFYPSAAVAFKNHRVILDACKRLKEKGVSDYQVVFTITPEDNALAAELEQTVKEYKLPVVFAGMQNHSQMVEHYKKSVLLFPSYLETVGLPLLEAKQFKAPIIAADCVYARETVGVYDAVSFFNYQDSNALAMEMLKRINE